MTFPLASCSLSPVFCFGEKNFVDKAVAAGVDGVIIPDLPLEEAGEFTKYAHKKGLVNICFLAPTSTLARIKKIAKVARGFIYYVQQFLISELFSLSL